MDANSGEQWSEADISDLKNELDHGRTIAKTASFLCRDVAEVREKMKELGLVEGDGAALLNADHGCCPKLDVLAAVEDFLLAHANI
jgi:hypothetical protein